MGRNLRAALFAICALTVLAAGCAVQQDLVIAGDGGGTTDMAVDLDTMLYEYITDLLISIGGHPEDGDLFDTGELRTAFETHPELRPVSVQSPEPRRLELSLQFSDIERVFETPAAGAEDLFEIEENGAERTLRVVLTAEGVRQILSLSPLYGTMIGDALLPPDDGAMSADQYRDYLAWALEEYAEPGEAAERIGNARIEVRIRPEGEIVSQEGGDHAGDEVWFSIGLTELLTLREPRTYSVSYRTD